MKKITEILSNSSILFTVPIWRKISVQFWISLMHPLKRNSMFIFKFFLVYIYLYVFAFAHTFLFTQSAKEFKYLPTTEQIMTSCLSYTFVTCSLYRPELKWRYLSKQKSIRTNIIPVLRGGPSSLFWL